MSWTKKLPTQPGWYWWRSDISCLGMVVLLSGGLIHSMFWETPCKPELQAGQWYGPLQEPGGDAVENCAASVPVELEPYNRVRS